MGRAGRPLALDSRLSSFVDKLTVGRTATLPMRRFVTEMLYGILASKKVILSKIAEALKEKALPESTERRLSRNLGNDGLDEFKMVHNYLKYASNRLDGDVTIAVDMSDIRKKYAKKMEGLGFVWDGSEGVPHEGYYLLGMHGLSGAGHHVPLYMEMYSQEMDAKISNNLVLKEALAEVAPYVPVDALWLFDRGYDGDPLFRICNAANIFWVVRQKGDRNLVYYDKTMLCEKLANLVEPTEEAVIYGKTKNGKPKQTKIKFGRIEVELPDVEGSYWLIVIWGFGKKPVMLLTNFPCDTQAKFRRVALSYGRRWACEEEFRFVKNEDDGLDLEDIRVLRYEPLRRLVLLAFLAHCFILDLHRHDVLVKTLVSTVWRLPKSRKVTRFLFYQLIHAVAELLKKLWRGMLCKKRWVPPKKVRKVRRGRLPT